MTVDRNVPEPAAGVATPPSGCVVPAYEPPTVTRLGTVSEITQGANPGGSSDLTFAASS
jgi:hypothetical protein